jgi:leucyl-tRNA synthetase
LLTKLVTPSQKKIVDAYIEKTKTKTELQRKDLQKDKTGVFTGAYAINPFSNEQIPIYVADYVLNSYATGVVMGVPAHDQRDYDFASKYQLPIRFVIETSNQKQAYENDGIHINSELINGLNIAQANTKILAYLQQHNIGKSCITYKMKD